MKDIQAISDRELFSLFVESGKTELYFRELMRRYKQKVYWQVRRILVLHDDADDVAQVVFIKLWKNAESFKFQSALSSFIYRIAYNESISFLKTKKRFQSFDGVVDKNGEYSKQIDQDDALEGDEIVKKLQKAMLQLPEKQRLVFQYKYFDDLPYKEISEITGTTEGGLKANYHIAVEKIKKLLELH